MKALTIRPHFAALIAAGVKVVEGRTWQTSYRGPLAIHAAAGWGSGGAREVRRYLLSEDCPSGLWTALRDTVPGSCGEDDTAEHLEFVNPDVFVRGAIVAVATLADIVPTVDLDPELHAAQGPLCDFEWATRCWMLEGIRRVDHPVPCTGGQRLWDVPDAVVERLAVRVR